MELRDQGADQYTWKPIESQRRPLHEVIAKAIAMRARRNNPQVLVAANEEETIEAPAVTLAIETKQILLEGSVLVKALTFHQAKVIVSLHKLLAEKKAAGIDEGVRSNEIAFDLGWVNKEGSVDNRVHREICRVRQKAVELMAPKHPGFDADMLIYNHGSGLGYCFADNVTVTHSDSETTVPKRKPARKASQKKSTKP